ncbi:DUF222 domain-containing protein [Saccharopolyspora sp. MS10]|uniref:HNH endonuclease signature motif containing protein n=1 Tax=Saccharopolyspora sp. MS10 TaxID=3385973 RepID=UPI0039A01C7F
MEELLGRARPPAERSDTELTAGIKDTEAVLRAALAWQAELITEAERRGLPGRDGARTTQTWLRESLNLAHGDAKTRVVVAQAVSERTEPDGTVQPPAQPTTADGLREGRMTFAHARAITDGLAALPPWAGAEKRAGLEQLLARQAEVLSPRELDLLAQSLRYALDQDGALRDEQQQIERRTLHLSDGRDGMTVLNGRLDRETGAKLRAALEPLTRPRAADAGGRDPRPWARRNADAFADLLDIALSSGELPGSGGQRPHLAVTIGIDQLRERLQQDAVRFGGTITTTGQPITAGNARQLACDAEVLPVLLDGESRPLDVGRSRRTAPPHLRAALLARDGRCAFPGCDHPPGTSEAHHVLSWADGGPTALDNLVMLCAHHHTTTHAQSWEIKFVEGRPEFIPPAWLDPRRTPRPGNRAPHTSPDPVS